MLNIPTIDFKDYNEADPCTVAALADKVASALGTAGFMRTRNLGISQEQVSQAFKAAEWFFLQDLSKKQRASYATTGENFGFQEVGIEPDIEVSPQPLELVADARRRLREADLERHFTHQEAESAGARGDGEDGEVAEAEDVTDVQLARAVEVLKSWTYFERLRESPDATQALQAAQAEPSAVTPGATP